MNVKKLVKCGSRGARQRSELSLESIAAAAVACLREVRLEAGGSILARYPVLLR